MVKDFDKFDMVLQAYEYENNQSHIGGGGLNEFFTSTEGWCKDVKWLANKCVSICIEYSLT